MGFKDMFLKEDNSPKKDETKGEAKAAPVETSPVITPTSVGASGVVDNKFVEMLMEVIAQNNIPGQDYFEFKQSIDAMANIPLDESNKFLSAFAVLSGQGCTKDVLINSLEKYMSLVQSEKTNFDSELQKQYEVKVKSKQDAVEQARIELKDLNEKIRATNEFIISSTQEIQQEEGNLQLIAANFSKSVQTVLSNLENDKIKINNLIK